MIFCVFAFLPKVLTFGKKSRVALNIEPKNNKTMRFHHPYSFLHISDESFNQVDKKDLFSQQKKIEYIEFIWINAELPKAFFDWLGSLTNLRRLQINCLGDKLLPPFVLPVTLQELTIKSGNYALLDKSFWTQARRLQSLALYTASRADIFAALSLLPELTNLLVKMPLEDLPDDFVQLQSLRYLQLSHCRLPVFPKVLSQMTRLNELYLRDNAIASIDVSLQRLSNLERIDLHCNQFADFPDTLLELAQIARIDLSNNKIKTIPPKIAKLSNTLLELNLQANKITHLPDALNKLQKLQKLDISSNHLAAIPKVLYQLPSLQRIDFYDNKDEFKKQVFNSNLCFYFPNILNPSRGFPPKIKDKPILEVLQFGKKLYKITQDEEKQEQLIAVFFKDSHTVNALPPAVLLQAGSFALPETTIYVIEQLCQRTASLFQKKPLHKGAKIVVMGNWSGNGEHTQATLEALGIQLFFEPVADMEYVLLRHPLYCNDDFNKQGLIFIKESDIISFLETQQAFYLRPQDSEEQQLTLEKMRALLYSNNNASIELAFEMMETGGVPQGAILDLFYFYTLPHLSDNFWIATRAGSLLRAYGSDALCQELLHKRKKRHRNILAQSSFRELCRTLDHLGIASLPFCQHYLFYSEYLHSMPSDFINETLANTTDTKHRHQLVTRLIDKYVTDLNQTNNNTFDFYSLSRFVLDFSFWAPVLFKRNDIVTLCITVPINNLEPSFSQGISQMQFLKRLQISHYRGEHLNGLKQLVHLPLLEDLYVGYCDKGEDDLFEEVLPRLPALNSLSLERCSLLALSVAMQLPNLLVLELRFKLCVTIDLSTLKFPNLTQLFLHNINLVLPDDDITLTHNLPMLRYITLESVKNLGDLCADYKSFRKRIEQLLPDAKLH